MIVGTFFFFYYRNFLKIVYSFHGEPLKVLGQSEKMHPPVYGSGF